MTLESPTELEKRAKSVQRGSRKASVFTQTTHSSKRSKVASGLPVRVRKTRETTIIWVISDGAAGSRATHGPKKTLERLR